MAVIDIKRKHALGTETVRSAVERVAQKIAGEYGMDHRWQGDRLEFKRSGVHGHIALAKNELHVRVELGFLMGALKPLIQQEIERQLDEQLA
jgi:putative polyhydroxyalkanoate system protein